MGDILDEERVGPFGPQTEISEPHLWDGFFSLNVSTNIYTDQKNILNWTAKALKEEQER